MARFTPPTCQLVAPVLEQLRADAALTVYSQDDPAFPPGAVDDTSLDMSFALDIDTVPTILRVEAGER